jgi:hypothetical protein
MSQNAELQEQLQAMERQFRELLVTALQKSLRTPIDTGLFHTSRSRVPAKISANPDTAQLETIGTQMTRLRDKLGEPIDGGVYGKYLEYCAQWDEAKTAGRREVNETSLAEELLQVLRT